MKPKPVDMKKFLRTVDEAYSMEELRKKLATAKPLRIKYGVDVTAPFLHIGHAVNLWLMRYLQECGHKVVFLIGDFTTRIGDPTGKSEARKEIPQKDIEKNAKDFIKQAGTVLLTKPAVFEIRRNSEWFGKMRVEEFIKLLAQTTHAKLIQRDMFQKRIAQNQEIHMHEMVYPILQGYDSYMLKSDLTIVGSDQLFNELMGRFYQERMGQAPQVVATTKITPGLDGVEKQSKSLGNYIALSDAPQEKFGKIMSMPDTLIGPYLVIYTEMPLEEISGIEGRVASGALHPMEAKKRLGRALVERYHGASQARKAEKEFARVFQKKETPQEAQVLIFDPRTAPTMIDLFMQEKIVPSKSEARRLMQQGGIELNDARVSHNLPTKTIPDGALLKIGKKRFFRLKREE